MVIFKSEKRLKEEHEAQLGAAQERISLHEVAAKVSPVHARCIFDNINILFHINKLRFPSGKRNKVNGGSSVSEVRVVKGTVTSLLSEASPIRTV